MKKTGNKPINKLIVRRLGIDTQKEHVAYIHADSPVIISEGFEALARIRINKGSLSIVASLDVVHSHLIKQRRSGPFRNGLQFAACKRWRQN